MKRLLNHILIVVFVLSMVSCEQEFTPDNTATVDFSGEWYYQLIEEDGTVYWDYYYAGPPFYTYNSSENTADKLWFNDNDEIFGIKALMDISGNPEGFTGTGGVNEPYVPSPDSVVTSGGIPLSILVDDYAYMELLEGKIIKDGAKVWQDKEKAVSDSIYMKFQFSSATFNFTSREIEVYDPADSTTTTEYIWEKDANFYQVEEALDIWIVAGHRQTGWEVYIH